VALLLSAESLFMRKKERKLLGDYWKFWKWCNLATPVSKVNFFIYNNYNFKKKLESEIHKHKLTHLKAKKSKYFKILSLHIEEIFLEDVINYENQIFKTWFVDYSIGMAKRNGVPGIVEDNEME
jgi:hypothetical protein